jgi:hypothetical protein
MSHLKNFDKLGNLVRALTFQLMEYGGTTPEATCDVIAEEAPDLYEAFGNDRVLKMCQVIHYSEIPKVSDRLQERFRAFNTAYFGGQLPEYEVRVVYDANFWGRNPTRFGPSSGEVDCGLRIIFITRMRDPFMTDALLHHMAHIATGTSDDDDEQWMQEMDRIKALGAPFSDSDSCTNCGNVVPRSSQ